VCFIEPFLLSEVPMGCGGGKNFGNEVRCSFDALLTDTVEAVLIHIEEVRLENVGVGELNVERGADDPALLVRSNEPGKLKEKIGLNDLVAWTGRGRHDEVSVNELVWGTLGELLIVLVGVAVLLRGVDLRPIGGRRRHDPLRLAARDGTIRTKRHPRAVPATASPFRASWEA
jgi:hypothetical protein